MNEELLSYLWFYRYCGTEHLSNEGQKVRIIDYGQPNYDAGPDVFNAKVMIDDTLWAGNVEFHQCSTDWYAHHHEKDHRYNSVILHVVGHCNGPVMRSNGTMIPQIEIQCPKYLDTAYTDLKCSEECIRCKSQFHKMEPERLCGFMERLLIERLENRTHQIESLLKRLQGSWEEAFYVKLARQYGSPVNSDAFEQLALSLPNRLLAKHRDHPEQIEALLYGQAGLLPREHDEYADVLKREYHILQQKYQLKAMNADRWRWLRMRPGNFPTIKIAELAVLIEEAHHLFAEALNGKDNEQFYLMFSQHLPSYWQHHTNFGKESRRAIYGMSHNSINLLLINVIVPFQFAYGFLRQDEEMQQRALQLLESLPPEHNHLIQPFCDLGAPCRNSGDSQALLQLRTCYCDPFQCLRCQIGHRVLSGYKPSTVN